MIDLRSDTLTLPTEEMREAMHRAELGDDSRDGDPTVRRLEQAAAAITGKQAALFVASGTMKPTPTNAARQARNASPSSLRTICDSASSSTSPPRPVWASSATRFDMK